MSPVLPAAATRNPQWVSTSQVCLSDVPELSTVGQHKRHSINCMLEPLSTRSRSTFSTLRSRTCSTVQTKDGQKMGKSLGNVLEPHALLGAYGADAVRFFFLKEVVFGQARTTSFP